MCHCPICDKVDDNIWIDARDGRWTPCYECAAEIYDCANIGGNDQDYETDAGPADPVEEPDEVSYEEDLY